LGRFLYLKFNSYSMKKQFLLLIISILLVTPVFGARICVSEEQMEGSPFVVIGKVADRNSLETTGSIKYYTTKILIDEIRVGNDVGPDSVFMGDPKDVIQKAKDQGYVTIKFGMNKHITFGGGSEHYVTGETVKAYLDYDVRNPESDYLVAIYGNCGKFTIEKAPIIYRILSNNHTYEILIPLLFFSLFSLIYFKFGSSNIPKIKYSKLSIISLALSSLAFIIPFDGVNKFFAAIVPFGIFGPVIGFILAIISLIKIYRNPELKGAYLAIISISIALSILFIVFMSGFFNLAVYFY